MGDLRFVISIPQFCSYTVGCSGAPQPGSPARPAFGRDGVAFKPAFGLSGVVLFLLLCNACSHLHSRALTLQLVNKSNAPVTNLAFEFPGGSFGVDTVLPGATRSKWFKPLSTGPLKIDFDDQSGHHSAQLLTLSAGDSGTVVTTFLGNGRIETSKSSKQTKAANP